MGLADYFGNAEDPFESAGQNLQWSNRDLVRRTTMVTDHVRRLRKAPTYAAQLAKLPVPDDQLIQAVRSSQMWEEVRGRRTQMQMMPIKRQLRAWHHMGEEQRALLRRSGYELPEGDALLKDDSGGGGHGSSWLDFVPVVGSIRAGSEGKPLVALERAIPGGEITRRARNAIFDTAGAGADKAVGADIPYASDALKETREGLGKGMGAVSGALGPALHYADVAGRLPSHLYRFAVEGQERYGNDFGYTPESWDLKEMSDIWEETGTRMGEGYFPDHIHREVAAIMPEDKKGQQMAKRLASGDSVEEWVSSFAKPGSPAYEKAYFEAAKRAGDKDFKKALRVLELGKVSFGRDVARGFGLEPDTTAYNGLSGGLDLAYTVGIDPLLLGGKVLKAFKATRAFQLGEAGVGLWRARNAEEKAMIAAYGANWNEVIQSKSLGEVLHNGGGFSALGERVARAFRGRNVVDESGNLISTDLAQIIQEVPSTKRAIESLRVWDSELRTSRIGEYSKLAGHSLSPEEVKQIPGIATADDVWNFMDTTEGRLTLINGSWGGFTHEHIALPRLSQRGILNAKLKINFEEEIDFMRNGKRATQSLGLDEVQRGYAKAPISVTEAIGTAERERALELQKLWGPKSTEARAAFAAELSEKDAHLLDQVLTGRLDEISTDIAEPAEGFTRLFRVQRGLNDIDATPAAGVDAWLMEKRGYTNWFTDDLGHARTAARQMGPTARLYYVDAPTGSFKNIEDSVASLAEREFSVVDPEILGRQQFLGEIGDWVSVTQRSHLTKAREFFLAPPANFIYAATHRVPENHVIPLFGSGFVTEAERLLDMGFDLPTKRKWMQELLAVEDASSRRDMLSAVMDHMFYINGVYENQAGRELAAEFMYGTRQMYARDGIDMLPLGGSGVMKRAGTSLSDHADGIMIPSFREMTAQAQRASFTQRVFGGINNSMVESFMGTYWKPAVLLRLAFIPRAAGEEFLSTLLRFPTVGIENWVLRPLVMNEGQPLWLMKNMASAARYTHHFMSKKYADMIENFAQVLSNQSSGWIRGMAARAMSPEELQFTRALAQNPYFQQQHARALPAVTGGIYTSELPSERDLKYVWVDPEHTEKAYMKAGRSFFGEYPKGHPLYVANMAHQIQRHMDDPAWVAAEAAGGIYFHPEQTNALRIAIADNVDADALWNQLGQPAMDDLVGGLRAAINSNAYQGNFRGALHRYHNMLSAGPDPENARQAALALADARNLASTPAERLAVDVMEKVPGDVRDALLVDERRILAQIGALDPNETPTLIQAIGGLPPVGENKVRSFVAAPMSPNDMPESVWRPGTQIAWHADPDDALYHAFDGRPADSGYGLYYVDYDEDDYVRRLIDDQEFSPEELEPVSPTEFGNIVRRASLTADEELLANMRAVPGFIVASPFNGERAQIASDLVTRMRQGDTDALFDLQVMASERGLENVRTNPAMAHLLRESDRARRSSLGEIAESPVVEGHSRIYILLGNKEGHAALPNLEVEGVAKQVVAQSTEPGVALRNMSDAEVWGGSKYQPLSSWATPSRSEANEMRYALSGDNPDNLAVGFIDVPDAQAGGIVRHGFGDTQLENWRVADEAVPGPRPEDFPERPAGWNVQGEAPPPSMTPDGEPTDEYLLVNPADEPRITVEELRAVHRKYSDAMTAQDGEAVDRAKEQLSAIGFNMDDIEDEKRLANLLGGRRMVDQTAENVHDFANVMVKHIQQLSTSPVDGRWLHEIGSRAAREGKYGPEDLAWSNIAEQHLPTGVTGPEYYVPHMNVWEQVTQKGFTFINRMVGAIAREPLFNHNVAKRYALAHELVAGTLEDTDVTRAVMRLAGSVPGRQDNVLMGFRQVGAQLNRVDEGLLKVHRIDADFEARINSALDNVDFDGVRPELLKEIKDQFRHMSGDDLAAVGAYVKNQEIIDRMAINGSLSGAVADTIPFIDDHKIRSQMSEWARNVAPFHFAEEQMLKRWARVLVHSPEAIRRAQLTYMGMEHAGIIRQNQYGEDVWVIPGSAQLQQLLTKAAEAITGDKYQIPVAVPFTGEVKMTLPGTNRVGAPSFSPIAAIPMTLLGRRFPELQEFNRTVLGGQAEGRSVISQILPTSVMRVYDVIAARPDTSAQYSSAMIQAMQYMEANDMTPEPPGPDASPLARSKYKDEMDDYITKVEHWTRIMLLNRAIFGFMSPAPPQLEVPQDLSPEFQTLLRNVPYEDALRLFMKEHPNATAYTVFTTDSPSGASMPTTPEVGRFLDHNTEFVDRHKMATPWLLPPSQHDDANSRSVYANQVKMGLRERLSPQEWIEDLAFAKAAPEYFDSKERYDRERLKARTSRARSALDADWGEWKRKYLAMNPLFEERVQSRDSHTRRMEVLEDTRAALMDPERPEIEHEPELRELVDSYYEFRSTMDQLTGDRTSAATRRRTRFRVSFANWGQIYISRNPTLQAYWHRNIEPEIGLTATEERILEETG